MKRFLLALMFAVLPSMANAQQPIIPGSNYFRVVSGTASAPPVTFIQDPTTGEYLIANGNLGLSTGGTLRVDLNATRLKLATAYQLTAGSNVLVGSVADKLNAAHLAIASQAIGDLLYASSTTAFARLPAVATGQVMVSAGTGTAPAWSANPILTSLTATATLVVGTNTATTGLVQLPNGNGANSGLVFRNAANNANIYGLWLDGSNNLAIGGGPSLGAATWFIDTSGHLRSNSGNNFDLASSGTPVRTGYFGTALVVGTNPSSSGTWRATDTVDFLRRNHANAADMVVFRGSQVTNDDIIFGDSSGITRLDGSAVIVKQATALFGWGTSSSFPALKRNGAGIDFRLGDDSAYAAITTGNVLPGVAATTSLGQGASTRWGNLYVNTIQLGNSAAAIAGGSGANQILMTEPGATTGVGFDVGTDGVLKLRNRSFTSSTGNLDLGGYLAAGYVTVGTNAAGSGVYRLGNNQAINFRNGANSNDIGIYLTGSNRFSFNSAGAPAGLDFGTSDGGMTLNNGGVFMVAGSTARVSIGGVSASFGSLIAASTTSWIKLRLADDSAVIGAATGSLPAGASGMDGAIGYDTTLNALVYFVGGNRYKLIGVSF